MDPEGPQKKPVLAREREARLKEECCRGVLSNTLCAGVKRRHKGKQRSEEGPTKFQEMTHRQSKSIVIYNKTTK